MAVASRHFWREPAKQAPRFRGEVGRTYGFLAIATDTAGNLRVQPAIAEASTLVVASCVTGGDNTPPTIAGESASPAALRPPDHTMRDVTLDYATSDNCGAVNCVITNISSNEPVNGPGDGNTAPDWEVVDAQSRATSRGAGSYWTWPHVHNLHYLLLMERVIPPQKTYSKSSWPMTSTS